MLIALDYDNTYNADKEFWGDFIHLARKHGHTVKICTMRHKDHDWHDDFKHLDFHYEVETIFCDGNPKRKFMEDIGHVVNWWIDDYPEGIHLGSQYSPIELQQWREEQKAKEEDKTLAV